METVFLSMPKSEFQDLIAETVNACLRRNLHTKEQRQEDEFFTIQQTSEFIHLSVPTLYGKSAKGEIPCSKRGGRLYFSKQDLLNWVKAGKKATLEEIDQETDQYLSKRKRR
jgi:predicted DNA-binding transcriptional regulator AlpA